MSVCVNAVCHATSWEKQPPTETSVDSRIYGNCGVCLCADCGTVVSRTRIRKNLCGRTLTNRIQCADRLAIWTGSIWLRIRSYRNSIFANFQHSRQISSTPTTRWCFCLCLFACQRITRKFVNEFWLKKSLGVACVTGNKRLDFSGDPDRCGDSEFFRGILPLRYVDGWKNFAENSKSCPRILVDPKEGILTEFLPL